MYINIFLMALAFKCMHLADIFIQSEEHVKSMYGSMVSIGLKHKTFCW